MTLFHLVYFFTQSRFFLPPLAICAVLVGALAGRWLRRVSVRWRVAVLGSLVVGAVALRVTTSDPPPYRRLAAERIARKTPDHAVILSAIEPAYLEYLVARHSHRRFLPLSRTVEYASKLIAPRRISDPVPPPKGWWDHRCAGLARGGAREAVPFVASEVMERLEGQVRAGTPVFLESSFVADEDRDLLEEIRTRFRVVRRAKHLFELKPR
jgi:hypothetical protein